jgi:sugar phosphate isomerase/epimerase
MREHSSEMVAQRDTTKLSRSEFFKFLAGAAGVLTYQARANPLGLPLGIQLYTVRNDLKSDFRGTLGKLAAMGYRQVEAGMVRDGKIDFNGGTPREFRNMLNDAGLKIPSCHFQAPKDDEEWAKNIDAAHQLGLEYMLCAAPPSGTDSLEAWKRTAAFLNHLGTLSKKSGMQFAYHNHNAEYRVYEGTVAYDELLRSTDPSLVKMEMDCFWTTFAGKDPVAYFHKYPGRFPLLHIKDLKPGFKPTTGDFKGNPFCEVGNGTINWKRIFEAAPQGGLKYYFVEQDMWDRPSLESARMSADYLKALQV